MHLTGKVALVTGASRGIGAATAKALAAEGVHVAVNYHHSEDAAAEVVQSIVAAGGRALAVQADARDAAAVEAMVATVRDGLGPIDVLVINASIGFPVTPFLEYRWEDFQAKLLGEMGAAFHACKAVVPYMAARESGSIVAVTSGLARHPGWGFSAHTAAKAALEGFVRALSFELGPIGIRVNSVAPGLTITDATQNIPDERKTAAAEHTPLRRNGLPEDIAEAVVSLAGSSFISGVTVSVNGGSYVF